MGKVKIVERKVLKALSLRQGALGLSPGSTTSARALLPPAPFLNFLQWVIPAGCCHLRSGRCTVNESAVMGLWRAGEKRTEAPVFVSEALRGAMMRRRQMLSACPTKKLRYGKKGGSVWHPRLPRALSMSQNAVCAVYTGALGLRGWGASLGDAFIQGNQSKTEMRGGINWKELWVLRRSLESWGPQMSGKLVLARVDNTKAVPFANYGARRAPQLAMMARGT